MNFFRQLISTLTAPFKVLFRLPQLILISPRAMMGLSFPLRAALLLFIFLLLAILFSFLAYLFVSNGKLGSHWWQYGLAMLGSATLLSMAVYMFLYFAEPQVSPHQDIEDAWQAGMQVLQEHHIDLHDYPLFLILGADGGLTDSLFAASKIPLSINGSPSGNRPLRWYVADDAVYLSLCDACGLSRFQSLVFGHAAGSVGGGDIPADDLRGTMAAGSGPRDSTAPTTAPSVSAAQALRGTMVVSDEPAASPGDPVRPRQLSNMPRDDAEEALDRLAYACHLITQERNPVCAINGTIVVLPYPIVADNVSAHGLPPIVRRDLHQIQESTQLHYPSIALVTNVEAERGFTELVRRVGPEHAASSRFGKGMNVVTPPSSENLEALAWQAAGAFEDWVYNLFAQEGSLNKPGNSKLFMLLCAIRSQVLGSLRSILGNGFSSEPLSGGDTHSADIFFGGCYFAATGPTEDLQAFAKSPLLKLNQLNRDLEWTEDAVREDDRYHYAAQILTILNGALVVGLVGLFILLKMKT